MQRSRESKLSAKSLRGLFLPFPTPFLSSGEIDFDSLRSNILKWNNTGIAGYVALGSTGERAHLTERERRSVIEAARAEIPSHLKLIVGAGEQSTFNSIADVKTAAASGAEAVLVLTPYFYRNAITHAALIDHYRAIADDSPVPVILYSMPPLTGIKIAPRTVAALAEHANIIGLKDSSADLEEFRLTIGLCGEEFAVLTGDGTVLREGLQAGASGAILAVGCVVPDACLEIFSAIERGDNPRAVSLQQKLTPFAAAVPMKYGIGGLKAAMDMNGFKGGEVRAPLRAPDENTCREIHELLQAVQHVSGATTGTAG